MSEEKPVSKAINEQLPLSENLKAEKIEAKVASDSRPLIQPAPQNVRSADARPATDYASVTPSPPTAPRGTIIAADANAAGTSTTRGVGETADKLELEGGKVGVKGSDLRGGLTSTEVRAKARERPVDEMLNDPLREVTRKERRSLLGISTIAILIGWTNGRVVSLLKIENFGINFTAQEDRSLLLWLFFWVVVYYTVAFTGYAATDALKYWYTIDEGTKTLSKQRNERDVNFLPKSLLDTSAPWPLLRYASAAYARGAFDFIITLVIAGVAMWSLWGAVHQVASTTRPPAAPSAPAPPAVTPAVPPVPSPKTAPVPAKP